MKENALSDRAVENASGAAITYTRCCEWIVQRSGVRHNEQTTGAGYA